jgi:hypothetical protein
MIDRASTPSAHPFAFVRFDSIHGRGQDLGLSVGAVIYEKKRVMVPGDRLFEPINTLHIMLAAVGHATSVMTGGKTHRTPKPAMKIDTIWPDLSFAVSLHGPLEMALAGKVPSRIEVGIITNAADVAMQIPAKWQGGGLVGTVSYISAPVFLAFFDRYNDWLKTTYGAAANWPKPLNFARVIRNAAAHGKIDIRNPKASPVTWRGITIGPADNSRQIIGPGFILGEIIALMFDVDDALNSIKAPIL